MRILLVEDDPSISTPLTEGLEREGFEVSVAGTGREALASPHPDLVLLDLGLPDMDGTAVCRAFRDSGSVPIIIVSARGDEMDRVTLLEIGADDYLVKPFGIRELVARIRAVARRASQPPEVGPLEVGRLRIDPRARRVTFDENEVSLTPKEYELLTYLATDPGAVFTREQLMREVWDENWWGSTKTLDVHVASLRRKLEPQVVETVRSVGYRLVASQ